MTYTDAMNRYGSDKPDLRLSTELTELTEFFKETPFRVFQAPYVEPVSSYQPSIVWSGRLII